MMCTATRPAAELVQRGERPGGQGGRDEAGAVRDQEAEPLGVRGRVRRDLGALGLGRAVADQHPVEPGVLVGAGEASGVVGVDDRALGGADLRLVLVPIMPMNSTGIDCLLRDGRVLSADLVILRIE